MYIEAIFGWQKLCMGCQGGTWAAAEMVACTEPIIFPWLGRATHYGVPRQRCCCEEHCGRRCREGLSPCPGRSQDRQGAHATRCGSPAAAMLQAMLPHVLAPVLVPHPGRFHWASRHAAPWPVRRQARAGGGGRCTGCSRASCRAAGEPSPFLHCVIVRASTGSAGVGWHASPGKGYHNALACRRQPAAAAVHKIAIFCPVPLPPRSSRSAPRWCPRLPMLRTCWRSWMPAA